MSTDSPSLNELRDLKKEVVEARNLVIKTDNLVKQLSADIKQMYARLETFDQRSVLNGVAAYIIFVVLVFGGVYLAFDSRMDAARAEKEGAEKKAAELTTRADEATKRQDEIAFLEKRALEAYSALTPATLDDGLKKLAALEVDRLSPLEKRVLDDRAAAVRKEVASTALDSGMRLARAERWNESRNEFDRAFGILGREGVTDAQAMYLSGYARFQLKDYEKAAEDLLRFVEMAPRDQAVDDALYFAAFGLEQAGVLDRARQLYERAVNEFPMSSYAPKMRTRIRAIANEGVAAAPAQPKSTGGGGGAAGGAGAGGGVAGGTAGGGANGAAAAGGNKPAAGSAGTPGATARPGAVGTAPAPTGATGLPGTNAPTGTAGAAGAKPAGAGAPGATAPTVGAKPATGAAGAPGAKPAGATGAGTPPATP